MASKKYAYSDTKTAMANRPSHIPQTYGGSPTVYVGGSYGYYNPTGMFLAYTAQQMLITDMMMHSYAPQVYQGNPHHAVNSIFAVLCGIFVVSMIVVVVKNV